MSAILHAGWNFVSKRRSPSLAFFFVASATGAMVMSPVLLTNRSWLFDVPMAVWILLAMTGMAQAVYMSGLAGAYRIGDISLTYPLIRALPVMAVAAVGLMLGRGGRIGFVGLVGMVLIAAGCVILPLPRFRRLRFSDYSGLVYMMVLVGAAGTTAYTLIDDAALRRLGELLGEGATQTRITVFFISLQALSTALMIGLATLALGEERRRRKTIVADRSLLGVGMATGVVIMSTYGLVLAAMAYVRDVSYVAAFRQLSIPIGALAGLTMGREPRHRPKLLGIVVITTGLALVGVA